MGGFEGMVLIIVSRVLEFIGIIITFFLMFRGYKVKYVAIVGGIVLFSITVSLIGLLFREYLYIIALLDMIFTAIVLFGVVLYVIKHPEKTKDFIPPENARCPFCKVYITREDELCTMKVGSYTYFFDSCDHLIKFMKEADFFIERKELPFGDVRDVFVKTKDTKEWKKIEDVEVVENNGTYEAYVKAPEGKSRINLKEILESFKNKVSGGK